MCPFLEKKDTACVSGADSRRPRQSWNYDELGLYNMYKTVDTPKPTGWLTLTVSVEVLRPNVQRDTSIRSFGPSSLKQLVALSSSWRTVQELRCIFVQSVVVIYKVYYT